MIDVIIPAYNAQDTIGRALASIAMQDNIKNIKVTISDDASTTCDYKHFVDVFSPMMDIQIVRNEVNGGSGVARQVAIDETDGDFIAFCDADDTFLGSNALSIMEREIVIGDHDIVVADFDEELENGKYLTHGMNSVWTFAKLYRRSFLDRHLLRFNTTRGNEDAGFNAVAWVLTRHIKHIEHSVYTWHWNPNSITRADDGVYASTWGHHQYIENMAWAASEMSKRNLNKSIIRDHIVRCMCRMYFMHMNICYTSPMSADESMAHIREYYKACFTPIKEYIPTVYLHETFIGEQKGYLNRMSNIIPRMTFNEFMAEAKKEAASDGVDSTAGL